MYETTVVAMIAFLVAGGLAAPTSSRTGNQDVTIEESSYHRSGNNQETRKNTTQHRVPGHVEITVVQGNSNNTHDETGNIRKVHLNGTAAGSRPININNNGDDCISNIASTTNGPDEGTTTSVEAITNPVNGIASTTTDSNNDDEAGSDIDDDDDNDSSGSTVSRDGSYRVPDVVDFIDPASTSSSSSSEEHDETSED